MALAGFPFFFVTTTLTNLDLGWNGIGFSSVVSLSQALSVSTSLTHSDLFRE